MNGDLDIVEITSSTHVKLWWKCKSCQLAYEKSVVERVGGTFHGSCQNCKANDSLDGNDLLSLAPRIARYYDESKNPLLANEISAKSVDTVYWKCEKGHSYTATVYDKVRKNSGCNECSRSRERYPVTASNNLLIKNPVYADEFDVEKNRIAPDDVSILNNKKFHWNCQSGHSWVDSIPNRLSKTQPECPKCYLSERSLEALYPSIAKEFNIEKNGIAPSEIFANSAKLYWWACESGRHIWEQEPVKRIRINKTAKFPCLKCSRAIPSEDFNFATEFPFLILDYDNDENKELITSFMPKSQVKVYWLCSNGHRKLQSFSSRAKNQFCPECPILQVYEREKSLGFLHPKIAEEFNSVKNNFSAYDIAPKSGKEVWWICRKDESHEWLSSPATRVNRDQGCIYCHGKKTPPEQSIAVLYPDIAQWYDEEKNGNLATSVPPGRSSKAWWFCEHGHSYQQMPMNKIRQNDNCPYCSGRYPTPENNLAVINPLIAQEFDQEKNSLTAFDFTPASSMKVWWKCNIGHSWEAKISDRNKTSQSVRKINHVKRTYKEKDHGCPYCSGMAVLKGFNDFAYLNPKLALEFDELKTGFRSDSITAGTRKKAYWKCDKGHSWQASIVSRSNRGHGCPECSQANSSKIEIAFRKSLATVDGWEVVDESNTKLSVSNWHRKTMMIDILAEYKTLKIVVEYDGYYYHSGGFSSNKTTCFNRDIMKTHALIENGYHVIRIREKNFNGTLDFLDISHPNLLQVCHDYKGSIKDMEMSTEPTIRQINNWVEKKYMTLFL